MRMGKICSLRTLLFIAFICNWGPSDLYADETPDAQSILIASDAIRYPEFSFSVVNTLVEYRDGKQTDSSVLGSYNKLDPNTGQFRSLNQYKAPPRDRNKLFLYSGKDIWFYDPSSKASIRLSPQQRLIGQASNGDAIITNFAKDYRAVLAVEEEMQDGDRRSARAYKLVLSADTPQATYDHIEMWIEIGTTRPLKARFYTPSGKLLKTAYFRHYQKLFGIDRPTEMVIIDGLNPEWVTVMRYSAWLKRDVPESWLQRDYLPRFKPE
jgi:outer membrane lipoprotein-sorting protein